VMPYGSSAARNELLPAYLRIYNGRRCHMALGVASPPCSGLLSCKHEQPCGKAHLGAKNAGAGLLFCSHFHKIAS
jgi:hypothetical protein